MAARVTSALRRLRTPWSPRTRSIPRISGRPIRSIRSLGTLQDLLDRGAVEPLDEERDEPADGRGLDRGVGVDGHAVAFELDEEEDGRLALLDPVRRVLLMLEPIGQGGRFLAKSIRSSIRS